MKCFIETFPEKINLVDISKSLCECVNEGVVGVQNVSQACIWYEFGRGDADCRMKTAVDNGPNPCGTDLLNYQTPCVNISCGMLVFSVFFCMLREILNECFVIRFVRLFLYVFGTRFMQKLSKNVNFLKKTSAKNLQAKHAQFIAKDSQFKRFQNSKFACEIPR